MRTATEAGARRARPQLGVGPSLKGDSSAAVGVGYDQEVTQELQRARMEAITTRVPRHLFSYSSRQLVFGTLGAGYLGVGMQKTRRRPEQGFTLLEVMMALLIGMVGLMGTVAVQQVTLRAAYDSNEAMVAMRLAVQGMEQFGIATVSEGPPVVDELAARAALTGTLNVWSTPEYLDSNGTCAGGTAAWSAKCRWKREWQVTNMGVGLAYNISVKVTYNTDGGNPKIVRIDTERRKNL